MSEHFEIDLTNYGDLDVRAGVCDGLDEVYPPTSLDGEAEFAARKAFEDECYEHALTEIAWVDLIFNAASVDAERTLEYLKGEANCRETIGDVATDFILEKIVEQSR